MTSSAVVDSFWLCTEMYSPVAIENAPATSPARPASDTVVGSARPPAKPTISAKFETRPSIIPNTVGRNQPPLTSRCWWWISELGCSGSSVLGSTGHLHLFAVRSGRALLGVGRQLPFGREATVPQEIDKR